MLLTENKQKKNNFYDGQKNVEREKFNNDEKKKEKKLANHSTKKKQTKRAMKSDFSMNALKMKETNLNSSVMYMVYSRGKYVPLRML